MGSTVGLRVWEVVGVDVKAAWGCAVCRGRVESWVVVGVDGWWGRVSMVVRLLVGMHCIGYQRGMLVLRLVLGMVFPCVVIVWGCRVV